MCGKLIYLLLFVTCLYTTTINNCESKAIGEPDDNEQGLYNSSDYIVILNITNLKSSISSGKTAWYVEFYNSWCGHCRRFAPTWKSFAKSVVGWSDIVTVAAIDCANGDNNPICRDYEIMRYPTLRYFSIGATGIGIDVESTLTEEDVRRQLVEELQKDQQGAKGAMSWPNIAPYRSNELRDVWRAVSESVKYTFFFFEEPKSALGSEIILDLHTIKDLQIRRVTRDNEWLTTMYKVTNFPAIMVFDRGDTQTRLKISVPTREGVIQVIKDFMRSKGMEVELEEPVKPTNPAPAAGPQESDIAHSNVGTTSRDLLYQADLENAVRFSLEREISMKKNIEGSQFQALKDYLRVIARYFPLKRGNSEFFTKLYENVTARESISGKEFKNLVLAQEQEISPVFTEKKEWIGCAGSAPHLRGYTCGVWTMFHTLTVNHAAAFEDEDAATRSVDMVLKAMHGYIKNFFGCTDCSEHFVQMADNRKMFYIETVDESVLWLWRAHNEVNKRLAGDATEDPKHPKIAYPAQMHCSACRKGDGTWNEIEVLNYLKRKYSYSGIVYGDETSSSQSMLKPRREPLTANNYVSVEKKTGWDFTIFDISIIVVLYIISAAILVLVCIKFAVKKSMRRRMFLQRLLGKV